ncbi:hypothetical protein BDEG_26366 [Batrachochytrium dendrobatidis JEL423]|uniref:Uncharacterized protein n=1 Tax=Batrachochytrium dendrobatidis (strain JEL423) TaxID=403673 RepID=A0A177WU70_BATDL|nr:hypothetical protein BDEG_26366 [Batrachochytrium dendrobatidis JEL423]
MTMQIKHSSHTNRDKSQWQADNKRGFLRIIQEKPHTSLDCTTSPPSSRSSQPRSSWQTQNILVHLLTRCSSTTYYLNMSSMSVRGCSGSANWTLVENCRCEGELVGSQQVVQDSSLLNDSQKES